MSERFINPELLSLVKSREKKEMPKLVSFEELETLAHNKEVQRKNILLVDCVMPRYDEELAKRTGYFFKSDDDGVSDYTNLGIHRIAGYLDKFEVPTTIIRLQDYQTPDKQKELFAIVEHADIIGVSSLSPSIDSAFAFSVEVKKQFPEKLVVGGAEHYGLDEEWILSHQDVTGTDACCTMQGELPMLALSLGVPVEKIGSMAYGVKEADGSNTVKKTPKFPRLGKKEHEEFDIMKPVPARAMPKEWIPMILPEMSKVFKYCGGTETGSGCVYDCVFCTSPDFMGRGYTPTLDMAAQEIDAMYEQGLDFFYVRDPLLNGNGQHFDQFVDHMVTFQQEHERKMGWYAFMAATKSDRLRQFPKLAEAGCVMIAVGVEDVVGDRKDLNKGAGLSVAAEFIDAAKEHVLVRTLLILGLPEHYRMPREELKKRILDFMKEHPQAVYRMNIWTPMVGTENFREFNDVLAKDIRGDVKSFRDFDTMQSVVDPEKIQNKLNVPEQDRWVKEPQEWARLRGEIMAEYLHSPEHAAFLETLKGKTRLGKENLLYDIAKEFQDVTLGYAEKSKDA